MSTLAIHVSMALVDQGLRVVLVDADLYRADIAPLCDMSERGHVGDILSARRDIHEVLERGPGGILVVPGVWAPDHEIPFSEHAQLRFVRQLRSLGKHADMVLMDVGSASSRALHRFWFAADEVALVTTPDSVAVMDCYAALKSAMSHGAAPALVRVLVNRARCREEAADVHRRLEQSVQRFLGRPLPWLGFVPEDPVLEAAVRERPLALSSDNTPVAEALRRVAASLAECPAWDGAKAA